MTDSAAPADAYRGRVAVFEQDLAHCERRARRNGNLNVVLFFSAAAALTTGALRSDPLWYWPAAALAVAFVGGLGFLQRAKREAAHAAALLALNREGLARLKRDWAAIPTPPVQPSTQSGEGSRLDPAFDLALDPATAADLDLLGPGSLQHLLNTPGTPAGQRTLHRWLMQPADPAAVAARQAAARELAPLLDFRDSLAATGRSMGDAQDHYERFVAWAEAAPWLTRRPALLWAARLLPLLAVLLTAAAWYQWPPFSALPLLPLLGGVLLVILVLALTAGSRAGGIIGAVEAQEGIFGAYAALFDLLEQQPFSAPELRRLQAQLAGQPGAQASPPALPAATTGQAGTPALRAGQQMRRLGRLMPLASIRRWMLFLPVELFTLWNIHLLWLLERWQAASGPHVRAWLAALGEIEALAALAALHHDHPHWCFPTVETSQTLSQTPSQTPSFFEKLGVYTPTVRAANLAHPLLPPAVAVGNDVTVGPPGTFLLVTGSNMSGKSTLLRAIGLNCVLAQMGAPACADSLTLPPVLVASSMRVQDSLTHGVSYFLAELQSLKAIVDLAEPAAPAGQTGQKTSPERSTRSGDDAPILLYLLDEILQGTNSAERQIAARHVIRRLVDSAAIGAVSTHDLALAAAPELASAAVSVHFTESFTPGENGDGDAKGAGAAMRFDYKLRPGVATSTNALKLMQMIGLFPPDIPS